MKRILTIISMIAAICMLSGFSSCRGPQYEESERKDMEGRGKALMQEWLDGYIPGSEVLTADACINMIPSGPQYLTDSVFGRFYDGSIEREYEVEVDEGMVFLKGDSSFLAERLKPYVLEALGLSERADECLFKSFSADALSGMSPYVEKYGGQSENGDAAATGFLPAELVLELGSGEPVIQPEDETEWNEEACGIMDEFIQNPADRPVIKITGDISVPQDVELRTYDMAFFDGLKEKSGLYFNYVYLMKDLEMVSAWGWYTSYERYVKMPAEDFIIQYEEEYFAEKSSNGKITVEEEYRHDGNDLAISVTKDGYSFSFKDPENWFMFSIYSDDDSEIRKHEYTDRYDVEANLGPNDKYSGDRYQYSELHWRQLEDGYWTLVGEDGAIRRFSNADELIIRDKVD